MKTAIVITALLCASAAVAQSPRANAQQAVRPRLAATGPASINDRLIACLSIRDGTRGRLDCFDAVIAPLANTKPTSRDVADCRYYTEQDQRLACFNDFAESIPRPLSR